MQLFHRGWDQHIAIARQLPNQCRDVDQPTAALLNDLKQRGLLEDTLVMFLTEFGRTVFSQGTLGDPSMGRDHHGRCFTVWLAGAGIKPGIEYGRTDDFCYNIAENPVHLRDLHATMLHILGIDHTRFTYPFRGLDVKLTGVEEAHVGEGDFGLIHRLRLTRQPPFRFLATAAGQSIQPPAIRIGKQMKRTRPNRQRELIARLARRRRPAGGRRAGRRRARSGPSFRGPCVRRRRA